jgi:HAD superfamily hydrolase (TIGR01509 family)
VLACSALLFDLDGLMVDSEPVWFEVQGDFVRARGAAWTTDLADRCVGGGLTHALTVMQRELGFAVDVDRDAEAIVSAFVARVGDLALKPGCLELIEAARRRALRCAVASSSTRRLVEATLVRFELLEHFDAVVSGDCVARPKPSPDIFLEAAARVRTAPAACVVLEDSVPGVRAARAAGMTVIAVPEAGRAGRAGREGDGQARLAQFAELADAVVDDLHAARALLAI